jgi:MFS family permease
MAGAAMLSAFTYIPILATELDIEEILVTVIVAGYATASFLASYIFGRAGDVYGRRIVIRLGLLLSTITFGLILLTTNFETLFFVRVLNGFCVGMYPGALTAYAYESKMKMGRFATWGAAGWGVGTLFSGYAASFNIYNAFLISTLFIAIAFASALTLPLVPREVVKVPWFPVETFKRNASIYIAFLLRHSSAFAIWTLWPLFLVSIGGDTFTIAVVQATNALSQVLFMATVTDRFDSKRLFSIGLIASAIAFVWFPFARNIIEILPTQVLLGFAWAMLYVGALKYVTENNKERSTASGLLVSMNSLSGALGPVIAAAIYLIWPGYIPTMIFAAIMTLIAYGLFWINGRSGKAIRIDDTITELV